MGEEEILESRESQFEQINVEGHFDFVASDSLVCSDDLLCG